MTIETFTTLDPNDPNNTAVTGHPLGIGRVEKLSCEQAFRATKTLQGTILTIVEASYTDKNQLKAVKDLIKSAFSRQLTWISDICYPEMKMMTHEQMLMEGIDPDSIEIETHE